MGRDDQGGHRARTRRRAPDLGACLRRPDRGSARRSPCARRPGPRSVPVSATAIRADPLAHWDFIAPCVRAWYVKRVSLLGAESTGTTTLTERLARDSTTEWIVEYGREYGAPKDCGASRGRARSSSTSPAISRSARTRRPGARTASSSATPTCWRRPSGTSTTCGHRPGGRGARPDRRYDLTFLTAADFPWVDDGTRNSDDRASADAASLRGRVAPPLGTDRRGPRLDRGADAYGRR